MRRAAILVIAAVTTAAIASAAAADPPARERAAAACTTGGTPDARRACLRRAALRRCAALPASRRPACRAAALRRHPVRITAAPADPVVPAPPPRTAVIRGFTAGDPLAADAATLVPDGGELSVCDGAANRRIAARIDHAGPFGTGVRYVWSFEGAVVATRPVFYPGPRDVPGADAFETATLTLPNGVYGLSVQSPEGTEIARATVRRNCPPVSFLGFTTTAGPGVPTTPPPGLTPSGGTITACTGHRYLLVYWQDLAAAQEPYQFVALAPTGAGLTEEVGSLGPGSIRWERLSLPAPDGTALPLANGTWQAGWAMDGPISLAAEVTVRC